MPKNGAVNKIAEFQAGFARKIQLGIPGQKNLTELLFSITMN
jgi:hypothetical protein